MKCSEVDILAAHLASYLRLFENRCNICLTYYCWESRQNTCNSCFYSGSNPPGNPGCSKVLACTRCTFGRPIGLPIVKHVGTGPEFEYLILDKKLLKTCILCFSGNLFAAGNPESCFVGMLAILSAYQQNQIL